MRDIENQAVRLQLAARGNANRIQRINDIRTRYGNNVRNANPNFDRAAQMQRNVNLSAQRSLNGQGGGMSAREQRRVLSESRKIMSEAYNTQVSRRAYMGLSNG